MYRVLMLALTIALGTVLSTGCGANGGGDDSDGGLTAQPDSDDDTMDSDDDDSDDDFNGAPHSEDDDDEDDDFNGTPHSDDDDDDGDDDDLTWPTPISPVEVTPTDVSDDWATPTPSPTEIPGPDPTEIPGLEPTPTQPPPTPAPQRCMPGFENASYSNRTPSEEGKGSKMYPGADCTNCHGSLTVAGTVFADPAGTTPASGVTIEVTDAKNKTVKLTSNSVGNFYSSTSLTPPLSALVRKNGVEQQMFSSLPDGACNDCHACTGAAGEKVYIQK